ncbi:MAG: hypothetical protein PHE84_07095 [bacterium]|nr:hypothetical protein [bacterium]
MPIFSKMKGSLMIGYVKFFKSLKNEKLLDYMKDEDLKIIQEKLLQSSWYPGETARHVIKALFEVAAQGNPESSRAWGKFSALDVIPTTYKSFLKPGDPFESLKSFRRIFLTFVDIEGLKVTEESQGRAKIFIPDPGDDPIIVPFAYMMAGFLEGMLELAGGKEINCAIKRETFEGKNAYLIQVTYAAKTN